MISGLPAFGRRPPPADPHALARTILSEPRFRVRVATQHRSWVAWAFQWLADRWRDFVEAFTRHVHVGRSASLAIGDVLLIGAILVVLAVAFVLFRQYLKDAAPPSAAVRALDRRAIAERIYAQSAHAAERGDYAQAVALIFAAALAALGVRGIVADDPSRTVNECRREVSARAPQCAAPFDAIAALFTGIVYADLPAMREHWERARDAYAQLLGEVPRAA